MLFYNYLYLNINTIINKFYKLIGKKIKIIGVGGTDSAKGVYEKILNGASLVQLYTGMYGKTYLDTRIYKLCVAIHDKCVHMHTHVYIYLFI